MARATRQSEPNLRHAYCCQAESARLQKQAATLKNGIKSIQNKLGSEGFVSKAPPAVVQKERQRLEGLQKELAAVESSLASLE